jgi:PAS domain S-box-containing protein
MDESTLVIGPDAAAAGRRAASAEVIDFQQRMKARLATAEGLRTDEVLRYIVEGTASVTGDEFFRALTHCLAKALGVRWAFVSEFAQVRTRVCMLAFWAGDAFASPVEYDLRNTPCELVLQGQVGFYPKSVPELFPLDKPLIGLGVQSFLAIPITNAQGEVLGHLAAMDDKPMREDPRDLQIFRIFGARAGAELERRNFERALRESEDRMSSLLAGAMDAIVCVDPQHRIRLFNRAAEEMFQCRPEAAIGEMFDQFMPPRHRDTFRRYVDGTLFGNQERVWVPEGLHGLRSDGEEFPIETTLSKFRHCGETLHTIIIRDINDRARAEHQLREVMAEHSNLREVVRRQQEFGGLVGQSPQMQALFRDVGQVAQTDSTVLIMGETGAGKEGIARGVHDASPRRDNTLVIVNCAALPTELIESELFGHEKGAFTGATAMRKGRFELADGGSIFLDEIGELSAQAQAKLLRVLQEQSFERVGGGAPIKVDVRVIAATNRDLGEMVKAGTFRADLYYRINVFPLKVPPLRDRRSDIPALAQHFVAKFARKLGKPLEAIAPVSLERLRRYSWPGNVRELQNVIERASILSAGPIVEVPDALIAGTRDADVAASNNLEDVARSHILRVLDDCNWVIEGEQGAAALLALKPSTLRYRMKLLGIEKPVLRRSA